MCVKLTLTQRAIVLPTAAALVIALIVGGLPRNHSHFIYRHAVHPARRSCDSIPLYDVHRHTPYLVPRSKAVDIPKASKSASSLLIRLDTRLDSQPGPPPSRHHCRNLPASIAASFGSAIRCCQHSPAATKSAHLQHLRTILWILNPVHRRPSARHFGLSDPTPPASTSGFKISEP